MVSLCMIVKNEEKRLARCLNSLQNCVDEIIIVDTGSIDNTIAIAKKFGAKTFAYPWLDDFSAARNFSLSKATGDWILYLDADEELELNGQERLKTLTENPLADFYSFIINNLSDHQEPLKQTRVRLFRNKPEYKFQGFIQEELTGILDNKTKVMHSGINIFHYGYLNSIFSAKNKGKRNHYIYQKMVTQEPTNPFYLYNLAKSYVALSDFNNAEKYYLQALKNISLATSYYSADLLIDTVYCLLKLDKKVAALKYITLCQKYHPDYVDIQYLEGEFYYQLGHLKKAMLCFRACLNLGEDVNGKYTSRTGVGSFLPLFYLAKIHQLRGRPNQALYYQVNGIKLKKDKQQFIFLARLLKSEYKESPQLLDKLSALIMSSNTEQEKLRLASILCQINAYELSLQLLETLPSDSSNVCYLKGLILIKKNQPQAAEKILAQITPDQAVYQTSLQELIICYWLSQPIKDASLLIESATSFNQTLREILMAINNLLLAKETNIPITTILNSTYLKQIVNRMVTLNEKEFALKLLTLCGLESIEKKIHYLTTLKDNCLELASNLALRELKKNLTHPESYFAAGLHFLNKEKLTISEKFVRQGLNRYPQDKNFATLLKALNYQKSLKSLLYRLENKPDHPKLINELIKTNQKWQCEKNNLSKQLIANDK